MPIYRYLFRRFSFAATRTVQQPEPVAWIPLPSSCWTKNCVQIYRLKLAYKWLNWINDVRMHKRQLHNAKRRTKVSDVRLTISSHSKSVSVTIWKFSKRSQSQNDPQHPIILKKRTELDKEVSSAAHQACFYSKYKLSFLCGHAHVQVIYYLTTLNSGAVTEKRRMWH